MNNRTKNLLLYILKNRQRATITELMKLCYLIDYSAVQGNSKDISAKVTDFNYMRYKFGPYDKNIYQVVDFEEVDTDLSYDNEGKENVKYLLKDNNITIDIAPKDKEIVDFVLENTLKFGSAGLTKIAYKTTPIVSLGAEIGNIAGMNKELDLTL